MIQTWVASDCESASQVSDQAKGYFHINTQWSPEQKNFPWKFSSQR